jgi:hypothetical protein
LDKSAVFGGVFTYDGSVSGSHNEIDVDETSAWGGNWPVVTSHNYFNKSGNGIDDPYNTTSDPVTTHKLIWEPGKLTFESYAGADTNAPLIKRTVATQGVPVPAHEVIDFNYWVFGDGTPNDTPNTDIIIRDFSFSPL